MRSTILVALGLAACVASCSWSKFDEFKTDTAVFAFVNKGGGGRVALVTDPSNGVAELASGGGADQGGGMHLYRIGDGRADPSGTPETDSICELRDDLSTVCLPSKTLVPLGAAGGKQNCFGVGFGQYRTEVPLGTLIYCTGGPIVLTPPSDASLKLMSALRTAKVALGTHPRGIADLGLLLGSELDSAAFVYFVISLAPNPPMRIPHVADASDRFGASLAIAREGSTVLYLVGAPGKGTVFAFEKKDADSEPIPAGCAVDVPGFGEAIAVGKLDGDDLDDVAVSSLSEVKIFFGKDRPPSGSDCTKTWPASLTVLRCPAGTNGCGPNIRFGASLAIGDLNADGHPEIAVGAPGASPDGGASAGAVYLFTPDQDANPKDVRYLGNPETGSQFGAAVAIGAVGTQDTLIAGALGKAVAYTVWCNALSPNFAGARCRKP